MKINHTDSTKKHPKKRPLRRNGFKDLARSVVRFFKSWIKESRWHAAFAILGVIFIIWIGGMYGIARWYMAQHANEPLQLGVTFIPRYARYFGLDAEETLDATIRDLGPKHFRLVSYWNEHEKSPGVYDFSDLDWQFEKVHASGAKISLAIGLRQPRWPECHMPTFYEDLSMPEWTEKLKTYMAAVIERYGNHPALESYQLENEFFMSVFGICPDFTRERLVEEFNFVKQLDTDTPVIISRSNNWIGVPIGDPRPDQFAISVYKRVWDKTLTKRYYEYPLPAWFYAFLAGAGEILTGRDMIIHELQAEPWLPEGYNMLTAPISEQDKSLNAERLKDRFEYARATGMRTIDFWGVEWWYYRKVKLGEPSIWNTAKEAFQTMK